MPRLVLSSVLVEMGGGDAGAGGGIVTIVDRKGGDRYTSETDKEFPKLSFTSFT